MPPSTQSSLIAAFIFASLNALMLAGMSLFAKLLSTYYGPVEVTFFRNIFSLIALFIVLLYFRKLHLLKTQRPWAHLIRSAIGTAGIVMGAWAVSIMSLAETTILLFTSPLWTVLLAYPLLGEKFGLFRLSAVLFGFIGIIIVANPTSNADVIPLYGILIGLSWGFASGCVDITLRWLGKTEDANTTVFYFVLFGSLTCGLHWPWAKVNEGALSLDALLIITGLGITGLLALIFKTQSYRLAEASLIAPVMYTMILWTICFDYIFWDKIPGLNVILGASIIVASNALILLREKQIKQNKKH